MPESEAEDESSDTELELSDSELWQDVDPVEDSGWQFLVDIFADAQPHALPGFTNGAAQGPQAIPALAFHTPGDAFSHFIDGYVISKCVHGLMRELMFILLKIQQRKKYMA